VAFVSQVCIGVAQNLRNRRGGYSLQLSLPARIRQNHLMLVDEPPWIDNKEVGRPVRIGV